MQAALKISSPVSSFNPLVEACCEGVGWDCAQRIEGRKTRQAKTLSADFIRRRIHQNEESPSAQFSDIARAKKTEIIFKKIRERNRGRTTPLLSRGGVAARSTKTRSHL